MPVAETIFTLITEAVFSYVLEQSAIKDRVRDALGRDPVKLAFKRALQQAVIKLEAQHPQSSDNLFDLSFFQHEGAAILAKFLTRHGQPDAKELVTCWADSLNLKKGKHRTNLIRTVTPVASNFLDNLAQALKAEPELEQLHNSRAQEQAADKLAAISRRLGADVATPDTEWNYLQWLIERNLYLDPRGIFQTQRQVQVKLDEVYISLRGQRQEMLGAADRHFLELELPELRKQSEQLAGEEIEDQQEYLLSLVEHQSFIGKDPDSEILDLEEVVNRHDRIVILGDPGSGKTTLLRHLALVHAQSLWDGDTDIGLTQMRYQDAPLASQIR